MDRFPTELSKLVSLHSIGNTKPIIDSRDSVRMLKCYNTSWYSRHDFFTDGQLHITCSVKTLSISFQPSRLLAFSILFILRHSKEHNGYKTS
jgi:hypothetical protein